MWTGLVTGTLMFVSPILFDRLGWRGVAGATPLFMLWAGMPFFAGLVVYTLLPSSAASTLAPKMLRYLVLVGAIIQVIQLALAPCLLPCLPCIYLTIPSCLHNSYLAPVTHGHEVTRMGQICSHSLFSSASGCCACQAMCTASLVPLAYSTAIPSHKI